MVGSSYKHSVYRRLLQASNIIEEAEMIESQKKQALLAKDDDDDDDV